MNTARIFLSFLLLTETARAHDGHGLGGAHWHASDALGFVAVLVVAAALWLAGRK